MKIKRLRLAGFGPYRDEQNVDFEQFDDDGIFLITGKTGAGKSSILDAICFALYASVPRYDGRESQLRSDHAGPADPTFVELEFSISGADYRLFRSPEYKRPKRRGDGFTTAAPEARLFVRDQAIRHEGGAGEPTDESDWRGIAAKPVDVGRYLSEILPLRVDQFLQVILLAQNRFQQFLLAKTDERRALLRTLFGTSRFEAFEKSLAEQSRALTSRVADARQSIHLRATQAAGIAQSATQSSAADSTDQDQGIVPADPGLEWFGALLADVEEARDEADQRAGFARAAFEQADSAHTAHREVLRRQTKRDAAAATLATLIAETSAVEGLRARIDAANRAAQVWPQIEARREAEESLADALVAEGAAREQWEPYGGTALTTATSLRETVEQLVTQRGTLDGALDDEKRSQRLQTELAAHSAKRAAVAAELSTVEAGLADFPAALAELGETLSEANREAARLPDLRIEQEAVRNALAAARRADASGAALTEALLAQKAASTAHLEAARLVDTLLARRLAGHAYELAAELVEGVPCSVCGSTEHPEPARSDAQPVTEGDTDRAQQHRAVCQAALAEADERVGALGRALADERAAARGRTSAALQTELDASAERAGVAERAEVRVAELTARREEIVRQRDIAEVSLRTLRNEVADAQLAFTAAETSHALISLRVLEVRGDFDSVADRAREIEARLAAARALEDALTATATHLERRGRAVDAEARQLAELGFSHSAAAEGARLTPPELSAEELRVRNHADGVAAATALLADPDLAGLPAVPVETALTAEARTAAAASRAEFDAVHSTLVAEYRQLEGLVKEAKKLFEASAGLIEEQARVRELAELVAGGGSNTKRMRLETYVLAAELEQIIQAANARLTTMTGSRYSLELDDSLQYRNVEAGLVLSIRDEHTGRARPTHSLSGGETFLASLALALGLAEVVSNQTGGISLDTLFVDEGFGTLDAETLEIAMSTLDGLRTGGRTIGLISHVESMKEQISAKLRITVTDAGYSEIEEVRERV
ncbi:AAA family ATPase [Subtercola boreus]|uniref:AAA family ATPase n=1 Tax=Subtercola boreus TaxID=120213 RepID=UPI00155894CE|nr:SMC family ATPase [Subtercola boreus]